MHRQKTKPKEPKVKLWMEISETTLALLRRLLIENHEYLTYQELIDLLANAEIRRRKL
jgi:hypothetical protein